jgi:hypothetical protein
MRAERSDEFEGEGVMYHDGNLLINSHMLGMREAKVPLWARDPMDWLVKEEQRRSRRSEYDPFYALIAKSKNGRRKDVMAMRQFGRIWNVSLAGASLPQQVVALESKNIANQNGTWRDVKMQFKRFVLNADLWTFVASPIARDIAERRYVHLAVVVPAALLGVFALRLLDKGALFHSPANQPSPK